MKKISSWFVLLTGSAGAQALPLSIICPTNVTLWTCDSNVVFQYPPPQVVAGCPPYSVTCAPPPGTPFPIGVTTVTCRVIDSCQKVDTCTFTVTVRKDSAPPVIQCPRDIVVRACVFLLDEHSAGFELRDIRKPAEIEANFDLAHHFKHVDTIFKRVFGKA